MNILFVCNQGRHRSKTAAELLSKEHTTKYTGIYTTLSKNDLVWADVVIVMEDNQRTEIAQKYPKEYLAKQILCLEVPDIYSYNQPELITLLQKKISLLLPLVET